MLLVHESVHHFGISDETFADSVAVAVYGSSITPDCSATADVPQIAVTPHAICALVSDHVYCLADNDAQRREVHGLRNPRLIRGGKGGGPQFCAIDDEGLKYSLTGGADTGGADNKRFDSDAAWFLGDRAIRYCIKVAPGFGVDAAAIDRAVIDATDTWARYVADHKVYPANTSPGMSLATKLTKLPSCDGSEDVTFAMGITNASIEAVRSTYDNPTAFAHRSEYDMLSGWGKGVVWVAPPASVYPGAHFPDWTKPCTLQGILLHEWGHVLGTDDIEGTIMEPDLTPDLQMVDTDPQRACGILTSIDNQRELLLSLKADYSGTIWRGANQTYQAQMFQLLTGSAPQGRITTRLRYNEGQGFLYTVQDEVLQKEFLIKLLPELPTGFRGGQVFKVAKSKSNPSGSTSRAFSMGSDGLVLHGFLTTADGQTHMVLLERNTDGLTAGPIGLQILTEGKFLPIFAPDPRTIQVP